ncbi:MAG TPA: hypothetical protein VJ835_00120 [Fimbriimonadaceae bacterium]|nr:hypothetical protein [Fimbriimonadaceae bacterium]
MLLWPALVLVITGLPGTTQKVVNDDRELLQAAMLSFFTPEPWHSGDWKPKKQVVLRSQFSSKTRPDFNAELKNVSDRLKAEVDGLTKYIQRGKVAPEQLRVLQKQLQASEQSLSQVAKIQSKRTWVQSYTPPQLIPIKEMSWDGRILVSDQPSRRWSFQTKGDANIERLTVEARASRPTYSPDGSIAILHFGIPWSIHSSEVWMVYERIESTWVRRAVASIFYV